MTRNRLYLLLAVLTAAGYIYIAWALNRQHTLQDFSPCPIKNATGIPCPSCGSTRSVLSLAKGNITHAALINPLGLVVAGIMLVVPFWLLYDVLVKKNTLYKNYRLFEKKLQVKWIAVLLITLMAANWIWNITKGL